MKKKMIQKEKNQKMKSIFLKNLKSKMNKKLMFLETKRKMKRKKK